MLNVYLYFSKCCYFIYVYENQLANFIVKALNYVYIYIYQQRASQSSDLELAFVFIADSSLFFSFNNKII